VTQSNDSKTADTTVNGVKVYSHTPADYASFVGGCCGYKADKASLDQLASSEKGELGERAAVAYAAAQGYQNIHPYDPNANRGGIDPGDKGVDVVATDPETDEMVFIEAKYRKHSRAWSATQDLSTTKEKGARPDEGKERGVQLGDDYIADDAVEKLTHVDPEDEVEGEYNKTVEGIDQAAGDVFGSRKEFVGIQRGEYEGEPIRADFGEMDIDRVHITQLPEKEAERDLRASMQGATRPSGTDINGVADDPWGAESRAFEIDDKDKRRQVGLSAQEQTQFEAGLDGEGELQSYGTFSTDDSESVSEDTELKSLDEGLDGERSESRKR
jgi:Holliday junction resolvase-like predicted endonuclease